MTESQSRLPADNPTVLLGVVTIVSGVATGLFADLRSLGQVIGLLAFAAWVVAIGLAFVTGPRLSSRTLVLTPSGSRVISSACPGAVRGSEIVARVALNQLGDQFVHIEVVEPRCDRAETDIRIRSEDLQAVLPAP
jgi:hypothetical protein